MLVGGAAAGNLALDGRVIDLRAIPRPGGASVSFVHDRQGAEDVHRMALALDGETLAILQPGDVRTSLELVTPGEHSLDVVAIRPDTRTAPELHGLDQYGGRVFLQWPASEDEDARSYRIYWDNGTGTVSFATAIATISGTVVHGVTGAGPSSGGGSGLVTIDGHWTGAAANRLVRVRITAGGFETDVTGAYVAVSGFSRGQQFDLGFGVRVRFESDREDYATGAVYSVRVGPRASWASDLLTPATYKFAVKAADAAGNLSTATTAKSVRVWGRAPGVSAITATWDGEDITLAWMNPAATDVLGALEVFANYSQVTGRLLDSINLDSPFLTLTPDWEEATGSHSFTPPTGGVWKFYLRPRHATTEGHNKGAELVTVDTTALPSAVALREPEGLRVTPAAGGTFVLSWRYPLAGGEDVTHFRIYANTSNTAPVFVTPAATVAAVRAGNPVIYGTATVGPYGGTRYFTVRAFDGTNETTNAELVPGVPDATAPSLADALEGVPT